MKALVLSMALMQLSCFAFAGSYPQGIDEYDPTSDFYYKSVVTQDNRGLLSKGGQIGNIAIVNLAAGTTQLLFKEPIKGALRTFLYEAGHKEGAILFSHEGYSPVRNNRNIEKRPPRNRLLIELALPDGRGSELHTAEKDGKNLKKLVTVPTGASWHIDVKNSKLRIVHRTGDSIRLENFDW
ncbi:MAG: hypothetical protein JNM76_05340 [Betaproteobacteria bacterium]|nr:hypothetical protein [Betaproteobacteria bacterium]